MITKIDLDLSLKSIGKMLKQNIKKFNSGFGFLLIGCKKCGYLGTYRLSEIDKKSCCYACHANLIYSKIN